MLKVFNKLERLTVHAVAFYQAATLASYLVLMGAIMWRGNTIFGKVPHLLGPILFLTLFAFSALICGAVVFGFPIYLFFLKNKKEEAIEIVVRTTINIFIFLVILVILTLLF